jgi:hypothetical protein
MFWDFYLPPIGECVVSRGCIWLEERGSIYLVDSVAIIEVRGEEVLAPTLDRSRLWRRVPLGDQVVLSCVERLGIWGYCWRYLVYTLLLLHRKT